MTDFRNLNVWKKSHDLAVLVYQVTDKFPPSERFGLKLTMRRTSTQISLSIAYSCGSDIDQDAIRAVKNAARVCSEFENLVLLARSLGYYGESVEANLVKEVVDVRKMIFGYLKTLNVNG
jgi:four helix bundle protein